eukprot:5302809-Pyramimonas_sp.AAC.1
MIKSVNHQSVVGVGWWFRTCSRMRLHISWYFFMTSASSAAHRGHFQSPSGRSSSVMPMHLKGPTQGANGIPSVAYPSGTEIRAALPSGAPEHHIPERRIPERRIPERRTPERRPPERRPPERRTPERRAAERRTPERRTPERRIPERRIPERRIPERRIPRCTPCREQLT